MSKKFFSTKLGIRVVTRSLKYHEIDILIKVSKYINSWLLASALMFQNTTND